MITNLPNLAYGTPVSLYIQPFSDRPMRERAYFTYLVKSLLAEERDLLIYYLRPNQIKHFQRVFPAIRFPTDGLASPFTLPVEEEARIGYAVLRENGKIAVFLPWELG
jgi:hypothetical protein